VQSPLREYKVKYRRAYGNAWEELSLDDAMDMIADRIIRTREEHWQPQGLMTSAREPEQIYKATLFVTFVRTVQAAEGTRA
jgi:hypothetical protein